MSLMSATNSTALDFVSLCLLATALLGSLQHRLRISLVMLTLQGVILTAAAFLIALVSGELHSYFAVGLTLVVKVVAIPGVLFLAVREIPLVPERQLALAKRTALALALAVALTAFYVIGPLTPLDLLGARQALPSSVAVMLLGLFAMLIQRTALSQVMSLVTMENGLYLAALAATNGFPLAVELGVALDALVATVVMALVSRQIHRVIGHTDTEYLRYLRH